MYHIIQHTRCSKEHKILLTLDNHESHITLQIVDLARDNGIVMLVLPSHASHHLQPLYPAVYGPFKPAYNIAMAAWVCSHTGETISIYDIPSIVNEAHVLAMIPRNILSGFQGTAIFLFTDLDFTPAEPTVVIATSFNYISIVLYCGTATTTPLYIIISPYCGATYRFVVYC